MRRSSVLPWLLAGGTMCLAVPSCVLSALAGPHGSPWWENALGGAAVLASLGIGLLVAVRRPGHPIGWLLLANGLIITCAGLAEAYAQYAVLEDPGALPGAEWAVLWDQAAWPLLFLPVTAIAFVFPDGRLPSPRWRPVAGGVAGVFVVLLLLAAFDQKGFEAPYERVDSPLPKLPDATAWLWPLVFIGVIATLVAAVKAVRLRFRRASGIERLQLKWLAYSVLLTPATLFICLAGALAAEGVEQSPAFTLVVFLMVTGIPVSVGLAVLRYRLYDIDRLINRTLVYGLLSMLLAAAYAATTLVLGTALGSDSPWATAGATLAVAAAFRPLRERVQDAVDRRFSRARYEGIRRIGRFLEELRAGRAAPEGVEQVLREVLSDPELEVRFWLPESELYVDARGQPAQDRPDDPRVRTPVERAGSPLGMVLHAPIEEERPGFLTEVVGAAGLAMEIARLRVELRRQLDEVEASRARIVSAGYEERRRIERDLHDGAQQRLVSIGLELRHVQHELGPVADGAGQALDGVVDELGRAIGDLRELARGVRPAQLDQGLSPALRELAARAPLPVEVDVTNERFREDVEAAAYFIASEGLTNAVKHSHAGKVKLSAHPADGALVVQVSDDGIGGADASEGSGLPGLADRVAAHAGTLALDSRPGRGTTLTAELPCG